MSESAMKELIKQYKKKLPDKLFHLDNLIDKLQRTSDFQILQEILSIIHKLAGSAGTYGLMEISVECKRQEKKLQAIAHHFDPEKLTTSFFDELKTFINTLEKASHG